MAFDGITVAALVKELKEKLVGGRITKIVQPEKEELLITIKNYDQYRLFLSVGAGLPLVYLTEENKTAPLTAPNFCMLLRKYIGSARVVDVEQPGLERVIRIKLEHLNELGDLCTKFLVMEIMGKHSNIILCDYNNTVLDAIRRVSGLISSVREVLPGREYFIPSQENRKDPLTADRESFAKTVAGVPEPLGRAICASYTGISPFIASCIADAAGADADRPASALDRDMLLHVGRVFEDTMDDVKNGNFSPCILEENGVPKEFAVVLPGKEGSRRFESVSAMLFEYYSKKNAAANIKARSAELRKTVATHRERVARKLELQEKQLNDANKAEIYKVYGDLLSAFGYGVEPGSASVELENFYDDNKKITIPLEPTVSAIDNAKHYYDRFARQRRAKKMLDTLIPESKEELAYLDSVKHALDVATDMGDLTQIREELTESGYLRKKAVTKKQQRAGGKAGSEPLHFVSSDGFDIYVGKNNIQNEELTFKLAEGNDWWFHAKGVPGSHVVLKTGGREVPDRAFEEAAALAAKFSSAGNEEKVSVDYLLRKNVKKPGGSRPGFVVYYTNYSMIAEVSKAPC